MVNCKDCNNPVFKKDEVFCSDCRDGSENSEVLLKYNKDGFNVHIERQYNKDGSMITLEESYGNNSYETPLDILEKILDEEGYDVDLSSSYISLELNSNCFYIEPYLKEGNFRFSLSDDDVCFYLENYDQVVNFINILDDYNKGDNINVLKDMYNFDTL